MGSKMIGIEIGSDTIKIAVLKNGTVKQMAVQSMPENLVREGLPVSGNIMSAFIKSMMKQFKIRGGPCALVLPPQRVVSLQLTMPVMSEQKLKLNLPFEFRDYIGSDVDLYDYDYIVLGMHDQQMDLYAAACRKDIVETYYAILKKAGLTLKVAMPSEMAWLNLLSAQKKLPRHVAIADLGYNRSRINIFSDGNFVTGKDIEMGGHMLDETIGGLQVIDSAIARVRKETNADEILSADFMNDPYNMIALEIMKTINFYNFSRPKEDEPLQDLYFCGGTSKIEPLREIITRVTGLNLHPITDLLVMKDPTQLEDTAPVCAQAVGAAMQAK